MSKFNRGTRPTPPMSAVAVASLTPTTTTYEGAPAFTRDVKSELFQLAVVNMVGEQTFYEDALARDTRYAQLVRQATLDDPNWTARLLAWLRSTANMRSAPLVGAAEYTRARLEAGLPGTSRQVVASVPTGRRATARRSRSRSSAGSRTPSTACTPSTPCSSTTPRHTRSASRT